MRTALVFTALLVLLPGIRSTYASVVFHEQNGSVVVEFESAQPHGSWEMRTNEAGFTGAGYLVWNGSDQFNNPGQAILSYKIRITTSGTYRFQWRSKVGSGSDPTRANDTWLRIPDADAFYGKSGSSTVRPKGICTNDCPEGSGGDGWFKVYSSGTTDWTWSSRTGDHDPHDIYADFNSPGEYTVQISPRERNHLLDRFVLYHSSAHSGVATNPQTPQSPTEGNGGSDPTIVVTHIIDGPADNSDLVENQQYTFTAEGTNIVWFWDGNSDGIPAAQFGTGESATLTIPANLTAPRTLWVEARGTHGTVQRNYNVVEPPTRIRPSGVTHHSTLAHSQGGREYFTIRGEQISNGLSASNHAAGLLIDAASRRVVLSTRQ